jgi:hypothetical protein
VSLTPIPLLSVEEAKRKIAELQRHIEAFEKPAKRNNHPDTIEWGMLFRRDNDLYIVVSSREAECGWDLRSLNGWAWHVGEGFDGDENEFEYLGMAYDRLKLV